MPRRSIPTPARHEPQSRVGLRVTRATARATAMVFMFSPSRLKLRPNDLPNDD
jgi:hypothetical protein